MGCITMIASGKDGVGKSTVCALLGEAFAAMGKKVLLIELENGMRCLETFVGAGGSTIFDLADVIGGRCSVENAIAKSRVNENLSVLYTASRREDIANEQFPALVLSLAEDFDHIIIDTDCSDSTLDAIGRIAMNSIVLTTADPMGLRDAKYVADRLFSRSAANIRLLINRVDAALIKSGVLPNLDYCIDAVSAQLIGVVPQDTAIALATAKGSALPAKSLAATVFTSIASRLDGVHVPLAVR